MLRANVSMTKNQEKFVKQRAARYGYSIAGYFRRLVLDEIVRSGSTIEAHTKDPYEFEQDRMEAESSVNLNKNEEAENVAKD